MKSKLTKELLAVLMSVKSDNNDVTLEMNDDNKESVYNELLIPLMNLTNSDTVKQLREKLDFLINGNVDSDDHVEFATTLVNYILDDEESDANFSDELHALLVNCMATLNTFNEIISKEEDDNKKENALDAIESEVLTFMNSIVKPEEKEVETKTEDVDDKKEAGDMEEEDPANPAPEPTPDPEEQPVEEPTGEATLTIVPASEQVDETPWGEINKVELKNTIQAALDESEANKTVVDEVFALVKSYDKQGDWQQPHHVITEGKVILNVNGLKTAAMFLLKPNASKNLTTDERTSIAKHLLKHYQEIDMPQPDKLNKMAEGKESVIVLNIKDDEMQEFGEMFKVNAEEIGTYIGLVEALLTDFVNSGIINIESEHNDFDESVIAVKLDKSQTEEFIKYFDIISDDIVSILSNDMGALSYKQTDSDLESKMAESASVIDSLKSKIEELNGTIATQKVEMQTLANTTVDQHLTQTKFQAIVDFVKSSDSVDDTVLNFIHNVIEAESSRDIQYMAKIGKSFMKATAHADSTKFVKKSSIVKPFSNGVDNLLDLVDESKSESVEVKNSLNKRIDQLSSFLD